MPIIYLMLDQALGEFEVETMVGNIDLVDKDKIQKQFTQRPIAELPGLMDEIRGKMGQSISFTRIADADAPALWVADWLLGEN